MLPPNCINGEGLTLDDMTVAEVEARAGRPVTVGHYDLAGTIADLVLDPGGRGDYAARRAGDGRQLSEMGYYLGRKPP